MDKQFADEVVDLEEFAASGRQVPPGCGGYRIRVNNERHVVHTPTVTMEQVAEFVGFDAGEVVCVRVRVRGEKPRVLVPGEAVDLTAPGVERFSVDEHCVVEVKMNDVTEFEIAVPATGAEVKAAAIAAGSNIKPDFVLFLELEDGEDDQVLDDDLVYVGKGACFSALDGDDNS